MAGPDWQCPSALQSPSSLSTSRLPTAFRVLLAVVPSPGTVPSPTSSLMQSSLVPASDALAVGVSRHTICFARERVSPESLFSSPPLLLLQR